MRKIGLVALVLVLTIGAAFGLAACGSSGGKEGGTLTGTYASFPGFLDPALSYEVEGWTAMYDTYLPLLTYAHANGAAGSKVVPALAESLPKITNGGKTYTLTLRKGLKYSDGTSVKASDFKSTIERLFKISSPGSGFYEGIVGAEKFAETKSGGIPGIKTDDKSGKIAINLVSPRGTFTNELGMLFAALLPPGTPAKNLTADPPPATGPYVISKSEPGRGWSYVRNPQWAKNNSAIMPDFPSGHVDRIEIKVARNDSTQVNEIERNKTDWMQPPISADLYNRVKDKYEGTQFRVERPINLYLFWINTTKAPFDDVKVRQAVNYAVDTAALERIYAGSLAATHQILPEGMPGHKPFDLYPHNMAKAKELIAEANPSDRNITVWTDNESPNDEAGAYYQGVLSELGFNAKLKTINADNYYTIIGNESTPDLDTGWLAFYEDYPHPNDFFQPMLSGERIAPTGNTNFSRMDDPKLNAKIAKLGEEPLGPKQEAEYAALDKAYMEQAPMVPYGTNTVSTFVSSEINLDSVIFNPTFGQDLTSFEFK
ncbi:MAG: peptide/nickel transport system substrate-binding protein [Solirubrobacterales bacterium]|nr:peptide/nickel transport system substrate-binding protein [Solirubrobacterales bacterium]